MGVSKEDNGIVFERFRATNAHPFKNIDISLRDQGLVRIKGKNGAGKSSVWHLFTQNLQGATPNKAKEKDLKLAEKDYLLETTFYKNGCKYIAAHAVKSKVKNPLGAPYGSGVFFYRDGDELTLHKDIETQKLIKSILGWSLEEWYGYVYLAQQTTHTLINGTRSERQQYLSGLFNLAPLDVLNKHYCSEADNLSEQVKELDSAKQELSIKRQLLGLRSEAEMVSILEEAADQTTVHTIKLKKLEEKNQNFRRKEELRGKIEAVPSLPEGQTEESLKEKLIALEKKQEEHNGNVATKAALEKQIASLEAKPKTSETLPEDYEEILQYQDIDLGEEKLKAGELEILKGSLKEITEPVIPSDFPEILATPDIDRVAIEADILKIKGRPEAPKNPKSNQESLDKLSSNITNLERDIRDNQEALKHFKFKGEVCDQCGTHLDTANRANTEAETKIQLEGDQEAIVLMRGRLQKIRETEKEWRAYEALGPDRTAELPGLEQKVKTFTLKCQYKKLHEQQELYKKYVEKKAKVETLPVLREKIRKYELKQNVQRLQKLLKDFESDQKVLKGLRESVEKIPKTNGVMLILQGIRDALANHKSRTALLLEFADLGEATSQEEAITSLKKIMEDLLVKKGGLEREIKEVQQLSTQIATLQKKITEGEPLYRKQKRKEILQKAFGKAGVLREKQLARFSRYLEEALLTHTIKQLPNHKFSILVDDGIDILATKDGGAPYDVKFFSGGEKGALSVAFLFALDDLLPPDRRTSLKIIDEIEAAFDPEHREDFISAILPELRKRASTVIVISHSEAANSNIFDRVWEIKDSQLFDRTGEVREFGKETQEGALA